jgi:MFS transporter, YNFM family, putative membrane transport protein
LPDTPRPSATRPIILLALASFSAQAMVRVTDSVLPQIAADLHTTVGAASIVVTVYLLAHGSVQLVIGPIGDRFGKYLCVAAAATVSCIMVALCGLAPSLPLLIAARLGSGPAKGWIIPFALAFVGDIIPYERRQQVIGTFLSGQILGQLFGQAAGGVLGDYLGWRNVFFLLAALIAIATVGLWSEYWRNPLTRATVPSKDKAQGFAAGYAAVLRTSWARTIIVLAALESGFMFGGFTYVGADLHVRFGLDFALIGLAVAAFAVGGLIYSFTVRWLVHSLGQPGIASCGGILLALGFATLAFEPHAYIAPVATTIIGLGFYMLHNTLQTNATQMTPEARGTAVSVFSGALYLGQTAGVAGFSWVFDRFAGVPVFLVSGAVLLGVSLWFGASLKRRARAAAL